MDSRIDQWLAGKVFRTLDCRGWIPCRRPGERTGASVRYDGSGDPAAVLPAGRSGVRIGRGVDLGALASGILERWGCPAGAAEAVSAFVGWNGAAAVSALHRAPLVLSAEDAEALTRAVWRMRLGTQVVPGWDQRMPAVRRWDSLTWEMKAAAAGVVLRFGWNAFDGCSGLKADLQEGRWKAASERLKAGEAVWGAGWMEAYETGRMMELASR